MSILDSGLDIFAHFLLIAAVCCKNESLNLNLRSGLDVSSLLRLSGQIPNTGEKENQVGRVLCLHF
jgi:hypothetical protein